MAKKAVVELNWVKSVSADVVEQKLIVTQGADNELANILLVPNVQTFQVNVDEKASIHADLTAFDGTFESNPASLDFNVGDLSVPQAPTGFVASIVDVIEE